MKFTNFYITNPLSFNVIHQHLASHTINIKYVLIQFENYAREVAAYNDKFALKGLSLIIDKINELLTLQNVGILIFSLLLLGGSYHLFQPYLLPFFSDRNYALESLVKIFREAQSIYNETIFS